jgi:hypothetical protein
VCVSPIFSIGQRPHTGTKSLKKHEPDWCISIDHTRIDARGRLAHRANIGDRLANAAHSAGKPPRKGRRVNPPLTMIGKDRSVGLNTDAVSVCLRHRSRDTTGE